MTNYIQEVFASVEDDLDSRYLFGSRSLIQLVLMTYLARGHVLLEGPPGTGKTLTAKLLAHKLSRLFRRIQFTSDLLPSDIIGTFVFNPAERQFHFVRGPIFADVILADEINRTPPRTQSALLEAMEERQISVEGTIFPLSSDFFVIATQNPFEMEGTFPLPEAQLDRFLTKVVIDHGHMNDEIAMMKSILTGQLPPKLDNVPSVKIDLPRVDHDLSAIHCDESVLRIVADVLQKTRNHPMLSQGSSVRGGIGLVRLARVKAASEGRGFITPDDIKFLTPYILPHRVRLASEAQLSGVTVNEIIDEIVASAHFSA